MAELKLGMRTVDVPFTLRLYDITEKLFDELVDSDTRAELTDGVMTVHSPTTMLHDRLRRFLGELLNGYAEARDLGEFFGPNSLFRPHKGRRYGPDLYFLASSRIPSPLTKVFKGVPDLVVEVLSPSNRNYDLDEKRPIYQSHGIKEIWLVDPDRHFVLLDQRGAKGKYRTSQITDGRLHSEVLRGFWFEVNWLWQDPLPKSLPLLRRILATHA